MIPPSPPKIPDELLNECFDLVKQWMKQGITLYPAIGYVSEDVCETLAAKLTREFRRREDATET